MKNREIVLQADEIQKSFPSSTGKGKLDILEGVSLDVQQAEIVAIIGSSGSGKSTLLHILGGLDHPDSGQVYWKNQSIYQWKQDELAKERNRQIGFVFQFHHLLPEFTALENIFMPALIRGNTMKEARARGLDLLARFGLTDRAGHRPSQLSGGEQQRVSMARALMNHPSFILADEPTGNLDEENTETILLELIKLRDTEEVGMVLITHEKEIAKRCDTIYELRNGVLHPFQT
ncbi:MAG: ABC transporter ATP-binding protein [Balneolaceae bacterium]